MDKDKIVAKVKELSKNKTYVAAACGVVALIVILVVVNALFNSPKAVANKFMKGLSEGDADKIMKVIYYDEDDTDEDEAEEAIEKICEYMEDQDFEYEFVKVTSKSKKSAKVKFKVTVDDDDEKITIPLKKVDGKWKVNMDKMGSLF